MGPSVSFCLLILSLFGTIFAAYPYGPYIYRNVAPYPTAPPYLVYSNGVYHPPNVNNNADHIKGHDFIFGTRNPQDQLLLRSSVYKRPGFWSNFASKEITFPPSGSHLRVNITQVSAHDRGINGTGGFVKMTRGGIGRGNVTLLFKSQANKPINFELEIFGVPRR